MRACWGLVLVGLFVACGSAVEGGGGGSDGDVSDVGEVSDVTDTSDAAGKDVAPGDVEEALEDVGTDPGPSLDSGGVDTGPHDVTELAPDVQDEPEPEVVEPAEVSQDIDGAEADAGPLCEEAEPFDYSCDMLDPSTCEGGLCIAGLCLGPEPTHDPWAHCGDGVCDECEPVAGCPADCDPPPTFTGAKDYDNDTTITVWLHGWANKSADDLAAMVYGSDDGCGGLIEDVAAFGVDLPCDPSAANQRIEIEYWGAIAPEWMSPEDVAEIEALPYHVGTTALERYARVAAKAIRHKLEVTGATHVNLTCHSFGCLVSRTMMENDYEGLMSGQHIVRWFTSAGVLAGARLAELYENPDVQAVGALLGFTISDWAVMSPHFVRGLAAAWDHRLHEGNNPLFGGVLMHHVASSDPHVKSALNIQLLEFNNPDDEPNDGIMYSYDTFFHRQSDAAAFALPNGARWPATRSFLYEYHEFVPDREATAVLAAAALKHHRKVRVAVRKLELLNDREKDGALDFSENGEPPAEIVVESRVWYNPYVLDAFGRDVMVAEDLHEYRTPTLFTQEQGDVSMPDHLIYEGPVFDDQGAITLDLKLLEVDWYRRYGVLEWAADQHEALASWQGSVTLEDQVVAFESEHVKVELRVDVVDLY